MQSRTLTLGWWALPFLIGPIRTIWSSFSNIKAIKAHRPLGAAQEATPREFKHARKSIGVWLSVTVLLSSVGYTIYAEISRELARADRGADGQIENAGTLLISDLRVGDCFNSVVLSKEGTSVPDDVDSVPCSSSHTFEIIEIGTIRPKDVLSYSGDINAYLEEICLRGFDDYVGISYEESTLELMWLYPDLKASPYGSTRFQCVASIPQAEQITFSIRDVMI